MDVLFQAGWPGLFLIAFLAATLVPVSSEAMVLLMLAGGYQPLAIWAVATAGNTLGSVAGYGIGAGSRWVFSKQINRESSGWKRAEGLFSRWGGWALLLAWVPIIGDPLCILAGTLRYRFWWFSLLVFIGKAGRYAVLIVLTEAITG